MAFLGKLIVTSTYASLFEFFDARSAFKVSPASASTHVRNNMFLHGKRFSDMRDAEVQHMHPPNFSHLNFLKGLVGNAFTPAHGGYPLSFPLRVISDGRRVDVSSSRFCILNIMLLCSPAQMGRIAAWRVVAGVKGVFETFRRLSVGNETRYPRGDDISSHGGNPHHSITFVVPRLGNPRPAFIVSPNLNLAPKTGDFFIRDMHPSSPFGVDVVVISHTGG